MKKKHKISLLIVGILLALSLMIGASYAYYIFNVSQSGSNLVNSDCFKITFTDSNAINLTNAVPLDNNEVNELTPYTFVISNVCNHAMNYDVNIETLNTSDIDLSVLDFKLNGSPTKNLASITNNDSSVIVNSNISSSKTIYSNVLNAGETKTFKLKLWIDKSATVSQAANKSYSSKVVISTSLIPDYKEATLISGPLFNKAIKQLAGDEPTESQINDYNDLINGTTPSFYLIGYPSTFPEDFNVYNYNVSDDNIKTIAIANQAPNESDNAVVVSTNDSDAEVLAWFDTDTIYLYSTANRIYMNENAAYSFDYLRSMQSLNVGIFNTSKVTNMLCMFRGAATSSSLDLSGIDISNVTDMSHMFQYSHLTDLDLSNFDASKVTNMSYMFAYTSMTDLNIRNLNSLNVKDMSHMFEQFHASSVDFSGFNTTSVEDMTQMFYYMGLNGLFSLDLSSLRTSNVISMKHMFYGMSNLTSLDISNFDTSKVKNMYNMFGNMANIKILDLSSFDTSSVEDMSWMFYCLYNLETIYVGDNWTMENVTADTAMTVSLPKLVGGSGSTFGYSSYNREYARVDCGEDSPGYFTYKGSLGNTAAYCASLNN